MHSLWRKVSSNYIAIGNGLDSSELALKKTVLRATAWLFLLLAAPSLRAEDCPPVFYPPAISPALHIPAEAVETLLSHRERAASCVGVAADLAQLYFWGALNHPGDITLAQRYFQLAAAGPVLQSNLRALQPALVLLGLDSGMGRREAVRRLQREIRSGDLLRRDKSLAVLNHVAHRLPTVNFLPGSLYLDQGLTQAGDAPRGPALLLASTAQSLGLLLPGRDGAPQLFWAQADSVTESGKRFTGFFLSSPQQNKDLRQQLWQRPGAKSQTVKLFTVFSPASNEAYENQCSATFISGDWLLTAAHCFYSAADEPAARVTAVSIEGLGLHSARRMAVAEVWVHAGHDEADDARGDLLRYSGSDIAMLRLVRGVASAAAPSLSSLLPRASAQVQSLGFPRDKRGGLWSSRCDSKLLDGGRGTMAAVYRFDCVSAPGQSGAAIYDGWLAQGDMVGVLSARARSAQMNTSVYAAFTPDIIAAIEALRSGENSANTVFHRLGFTDMASAGVNKLP